MKEFELWLWRYALSHLSDVRLPNGKQAAADMLANWAAAKKVLPACCCVEAHEPNCPGGG